jgi:hypothetical protein
MRSPYADAIQNASTIQNADKTTTTAQPWKSGASAPRKAHERNRAFSPCGAVDLQSMTP